MRIQPQLATLAQQAPAGDHWLHEIKYDGFRLVANVEDGAVRLFTRNGNDVAARAGEIPAAVAALGATDLVFDGELILLRPDGLSDFERLRARLHAGGGSGLAYQVWDVPRLGGEDLTGVPLRERKALLRQLLGSASPVLRFTDHVQGCGPDVFAAAAALGAEGIVSKRADSAYRPGRRTRTWLKVKAWRERDFIVGGWTDERSESFPMGALLLGVQEGDDLRYVGRAALGFGQTRAASVRDELAPLSAEHSPFSSPPSRATARVAHWVRPERRARIRFLEITAAGHLRHPTLRTLEPLTA